MKTLVEYIKESCESDSKAKSFKFKFNDKYEGVDEFLKSFGENECVTVDEEEKTVTVSAKTDCEECAKAYELIQDYLHLRNSDTKKASDESYAESVHKNMDKLAEWGEWTDDQAAAESGEDDKDSKEEKDDKSEKDTDKKEEE